jgi:hypothetical protein
MLTASTGSRARRTTSTTSIPTDARDPRNPSIPGNGRMGGALTVVDGASICTVSPGSLAISPRL